MRPRSFYVVFEFGRAIGVFEGAEAARKASGGQRNYKSFRHKVDAEEFAAWWNYRREQELAPRSTAIRFTRGAANAAQEP